MQPINHPKLRNRQAEANESWPKYVRPLLLLYLLVASGIRIDPATIDNPTALPAPTNKTGYHQTMFALLRKEASRGPLNIAPPPHSSYKTEPRPSSSLAPLAFLACEHLRGRRCQICTHVYIQGIVRVRLRACC